jgi:hypothetical protein
MRFGWLLLVSLLAPTSHAGALARITDQLPELHAPPQGETQWVAKSMRMNGLPMTIKSFRSRLSALDVLHHYEAWTRGRYANESSQAKNGDWHVLALRTNEHYISIQARDGQNGSHGTIAVSAKLEGRQLKVESRFPRPIPSQIVNLQEYEDFGMESEHISLMSVRAPQVEAHTYASLLRREGWQLIREQPTREVTRGYVIEAQKGAQHAIVTIVPDQTDASKTAIVIVWKKT